MTKIRSIVILLAISLFCSAMNFASVTAEPQTFTVNGHTVIEAEDVTILYPDIIQIVDNLEASGDKEIYLNANFESDSTEANIMRIEIPINVTKSGRYVFYFKMRTPGAYKTMYVKLGNASKFLGWNGLQKDNKFFYQPVDSYILTEGTHKISVGVRQGYFSIDQFIFSQIALPDSFDNGAFDYNDITNNEYNLSYSLPQVLDEGVRPRLLLQRDKISEVKANLESDQNKAMYQRLLADAGKDYASCALDISKTKNHNYDYLAYIEANALLYALNGDPSNAQKAIKGIKEYLPTYRAAYEILSESRDACNAVFRASLVYDWCYNALTDDDKNLIINESLKIFAGSEYGLNPLQTFWNAYNSNHGEENVLLKNMLGFSIAVFDELPLMFNWAYKKIRDEFIFSRNFRYTDSDFNPMGDNYGIGRSTSDLFLKQLLVDLGEGDLIVDNQRMLPYQFIYRRNPNGAFMRDGDCYEYPVHLGYVNNTTMMFLASNIFKDPYIKQEMYRTYRNGNNISMSDMDISPAMFLVLNDVNLQPADRTELPLSKYFGNKTGVMVARTGWEDGLNSNTMTVSMKLQERHLASHSHRDSGHFYIYYKSPLAIDSGIYDPPDTASADRYAHMNNYYHETVAHNSMLISDKGQRVISDSAITDEEKMGTVGHYGDVLGYDYGEDMNAPSYTYLKGDLKEAYENNPASPTLVDEYTRSFMFFNFFDEEYPGALIVFDRIRSVEANAKKTWLLHSVKEPDISGNTVTIKNTTDYGYNGRLINDTLLPKTGHTITKKGGSDFKFYNNLTGINYFLNPHPLAWMGEESGEWRVEIDSNATEEYFLNVLQASENDDNIVKLESKLHETSTHYGAQIKDRVAYFSKSKERTTNNVTVTAEGEGEFSFVVCDLQEGTWEVYQESTLIDTINISDNGGVGTFDAAAGTYELRYKDGTFTPKDFNILNSTLPQEEYYTSIFYRAPELSNRENFIYLESKAEYKNGIVYAPLSSISAFAGANITEEDGNITVSKGGRSIKFFKNSGKVIADSQERFSEGLSYPKNNTLYVPMSALKYVFKYNYSYDDISNILYLINDNASESRLNTTTAPYPYQNVYYKNEDRAITFASTPDISGYEMYKYGVLCHPSVQDMDFSTPEVIDYRGYAKRNSNGAFGIELADVNKLLPSVYYVRPYAIYKNQSGEEVTLISDKAITVDKQQYIQGGIE